MTSNDQHQSVPPPADAATPETKEMDQQVGDAARAGGGGVHNVGEIVRQGAGFRGDMIQEVSEAIKSREDLAR